MRFKKLALVGTFFAASLLPTPTPSNAIGACFGTQRAGYAAPNSTNTGYNFWGEAYTPNPNWVAQSIAFTNPQQYRAVANTSSGVSLHSASLTFADGTVSNFALSGFVWTYYNNLSHGFLHLVRVCVG